ncbi:MULTISPECIES: hypothetical protein [unclassified Novosphingobium]|uniref:hypothetical protein n=1 Tax=unclassified Novosphingobium TaxID=2644732 RepID=UPI00086C92D9|nr:MULTISPECIES: hypothetical protein [unclassified Novosphingobium]MBN9145378.1 hypothetical protein [Novosphingobium sp.]MDR6709882.1 hypothetical protein [Novosphingobium sp. 1748]ODU83157.1 MAG: hypothetical protein ABT10_08195 [Novosphingobium sp. SCN 63-17]OJX88101.1 MAG: hypothetical protein BGP00_01945 [Novosphingobium sp. 63-713]
MTIRTALFALVVAASFAAPPLSLAQPGPSQTAKADLQTLAADPVPPLKSRIMGYTVTSFPKSR